jgi:hypothetical protein
MPKDVDRGGGALTPPVAQGSGYGRGSSVPGLAQPVLLRRPLRGRRVKLEQRQ